MSNYLTTDGLKKNSPLREAPLRPEASSICHICHMVNSALDRDRQRQRPDIQRRCLGSLGTLDLGPVDYHQPLLPRVQWTASWWCAGRRIWLTARRYLTTIAHCTEWPITTLQCISSANDTQNTAQCNWERQTHRHRDIPRHTQRERERERLTDKELIRQTNMSTDVRNFTSSFTHINITQIFFSLDDLVLTLWYTTAVLFSCGLGPNCPNMLVSHLRQLGLCF